MIFKSEVSCHHPFHLLGDETVVQRGQVTSLRRNREAELVLEPRPPDFPGDLCSTLSFSLRNGLDQVHVISPHVVVCKLYVAINRTLLV